MWTFRQHEFYLRWLQKQTPKSQRQIDSRLQKIELHNHFGHVRDLGDGLAELKFNDGRRIYFSVTGINDITLILGGNKNGQEKVIKKAKKLLYR